MFGMSMTELLIIAVLALVLLGPDDLPNAARTIGKTIRDLQKAGDELRDTFEREVMSEVKRPNEPPLGVLAKAKDQLTAIGNSLANEVKDAAKVANPPPPAPVPPALPKPAAAPTDNTKESA